MLLSCFVVGMLSVGMIVLGAGVVAAQDYPNKPIRVLAPAAGGGADFAVRIIAQGVAASLGQLIIDNRASQLIVGDLLTKSPPDGYTLAYTGSGIWITPLLQKTAYDPVRDFSPITLATSSPTVLVVHPSLPVKSVKELIALAKARPGDLNYASAGIGGQGHLSGELFKAMAGVNIVHVPYKGGGAALNDLLSGLIQMTLDGGSALNAHIKAGRVRALAVTSAKPSALFPGLPTISDAGLPGYESAQLNTVFAPVKTPEAIINRVNREIVQFLHQPDVKQRFLNSGVDAVGSSPEELAATMKADIARWSKVIKDAGIRSE